MAHRFRLGLVGLPIVLAAAPLTAQPSPVRLGTPAVVISHEFSRIAAVAELRDGRLVVADSRDHLLYLVDPRTDRVTQLGTRGSGPGEYQNAWGLVRVPGDTILSYDPSNRRFLKIAPDGRIAGEVPITVRSGLAAPRSADAQGRLYWDRVVIEQNPVKRRQTRDLVRWTPGAETVEIVAHPADHAVTMHAHQFHPFAERDAWVVAPDGRVGLLVASAYRLRWLGDGGRVLSEGPVLAGQPVPIAAADRQAYRIERARSPSGMASTSGGGASSIPSPAAVRQMEEAFPDNMFPRFKPPFDENAAWRAPGGDIWVERTGPAGAARRLVDVLAEDGSLKRRVQLPDGRRMLGLEGGGIYLVREDEDGLQYLERYAWPAGWR